MPDPDWKEGGVYTIYVFGPHTYLQYTIFMTMPTNDGAIAQSSHATLHPCNALLYNQALHGLLFACKIKPSAFPM